MFPSTFLHPTLPPSPKTIQNVRKRSKMSQKQLKKSETSENIRNVKNLQFFLPQPPNRDPNRPARPALFKQGGGVEGGGRQPPPLPSANTAGGVWGTLPPQPHLNFFFDGRPEKLLKIDGRTQTEKSMNREKYKILRLSKDAFNVQIVEALACN